LATVSLLFQPSTETRRRRRRRRRRTPR